MTAFGHAAITPPQGARASADDAEAAVESIADISSMIDGLADERRDLGASLCQIHMGLSQLAWMARAGLSASERAPHFERELARVRFAAGQVLEQHRAAGPDHDRRLQSAVVVLASRIERATETLRGAGEDPVRAPARPRGVASAPVIGDDGLQEHAS